ncbi:MAG: hypothetical protein L0154_05050 [Chloroflexi bacterium]|nr:hypothetical protein [Chloroflexota bacterium]
MSWLAPRNWLPLLTIPLLIGVIGATSLLGEMSAGITRLETPFAPNSTADYRPWGRVRFGPVNDRLSTSVAAQQQATLRATSGFDPMVVAAQLTPTPTVIIITDTVTPSATPTRTPTVTASVTVTPISTATPSLTNTASPTSSATTAHTPTRTPTYTRTPTNTHTAKATATRTPTYTRTPTDTRTATAIHTRTPTRTSTMTPHQHRGLYSVSNLYGDQLFHATNQHTAQRDRHANPHVNAEQYSYLYPDIDGNCDQHRIFHTDGNPLYNPATGLGVLDRSYCDAPLAGA